RTAHHIKHAGVVVTRRVLTAETDKAEAAFQTDPRLTGRVRGATIINVNTVLEGELGLQAVAQILGTTEADARSRQQAGLHTVELVVADLAADDTGVDHAVDLHVRLGERRSGHEASN